MQTEMPAADDPVFGPYWDGLTEVFADPLEVYRSLQRSTGGRLRQVVKDARRSGPADAEGDSEETLASKAAERALVDGVAFPAIEQLLTATRIAFQMKPFDRSTGKGATERHCSRVLSAYFAFLAAEKKATDS